MSDILLSKNCFLRMSNFILVRCIWIMVYQIEHFIKHIFYVPVKTL